MWIAAKLTLALAVVFALVLTVQAVFHYRQVIELQERETRDDVTTLARALGNAASQIWANSGEAAARAYIQDADARRARTRIALLTGQGQLTDDDTRRRGGHLVANARLKLAGPSQAYVEVRRSLEHEREYRNDIILTQTGTTAALVLLSAVVALGLGFLLIGRPVRLLVGQAQRAGRGDFDQQLSLTQRDELGRLASELNTMIVQLGKTRDQLAQQRRERAALQEELRHADRLSTVGKVSSAIAHEFGTPLNVVAGRAAMIGDEAKDEAVVEGAKIIGEQAGRMTKIIRELLDFARRNVVDKERVVLAEVLAQATTIIEPIAETKGVTIVVERGDELSAAIDRGKTLQLLTNLMMNGVQAMPAGGTLTLGARVEQVDEPQDDRAEPGEHVVLFVRDEGVGIASEDLAQIFRPFYTTKRAGTGLGLHICHGITRDQDGWIEVTSEVGKGSTFSVYLPYETEKGDRS